MHAHKQQVIPFNEDINEQWSRMSLAGQTDY